MIIPRYASICRRDTRHVYPWTRRVCGAFYLWDSCDGCVCEDTTCTGPHASCTSTYVDFKELVFDLISAFLSHPRPIILRKYTLEYHIFLIRSNLIHYTTLHSLDLRPIFREKALEFMERRRRRRKLASPSSSSSRLYLLFFSLYLFLYFLVLILISFATLVLCLFLVFFELNLEFQV